MIQEGRGFPLPRGPVLGWASFSGPYQADLPSVQDLPYVAPTSSGRAAIFQALRLSALPANAKVLVPTYHCPTIIAPVLLAELKPVFYAIRDDGLPDLSSLSRKNVENARAIIVVHYFGLARSLREIRVWCDQNDVVLIEDCAHAFFGQAGEQPVGSWGDYAIASATKFFPVPEAGFLASARHPIGGLALVRQSGKAHLKGCLDLLETGAAHDRFQGLNVVLKMLFRIKNRGRIVFQSLPIVVDGFDKSAAAMMETCDMGRVAQMSLGVSRQLLRTLPRARIVMRRRENYSLYTRRFSDVLRVHVLFPELPPQTAPYVFPLWVDAADEVYAGLRAAGAPVFRWDRVWPGTPRLSGDQGLAWSRHVLQLLCHQDLSAGDVDFIVRCTRKLAKAS